MDDTNRKCISLFSGAMGLDIGLSLAGIDIVIGQDVDGACALTMVRNGHPCIAGDIRKISPAEMLEASHMKRGEPFLICGGPPCQPFSTAGKRLGLNDPRGSLFMDFARMIAGIQPRFFIMENVKGLLSARLKDVDGRATEAMVLDLVLEEIKKLGYSFKYGVLDAVNYGVPQFRERFVLIASRDNEPIFLPYPSHFHTHQNPAYRWQTLRTAIADLEQDPGECAAFSESREKFLRFVPPGGNWRSLPPGMIREAMGGAYESGGGKVGFYRRLDYDQPSPTVVTSPVQKATMMCHPTQTRPLSVREYARIQQFPDDWQISGTLSDKYRQIGNAVPVGLAKAIGQAIVATAEGSAEVKVRRTRGTGLHNKMQAAMEIGGNDHA